MLIKNAISVNKSTYKKSSSLVGANCLGVVLAGGLSSRMGQNKATLVRKNTDMLSFSQKILHDAGASQVVISGNQYQVPDLFSQAGPVGGIYSVIEKYQPKALLILPVDLPLITVEVLAQLRITGELTQKACFYQAHSIPLYLPNNAYLTLFLQQAFQQGSFSKKGLDKEKRGPSFKALLAQVPHKELLLTKNEHLFNTNTPEQWLQAKQQFTSNSRF